MIVISVSKTYWNRGVKNHRKNAKKIWIVYSLDENDGYRLHTMRVNALQALYYKSQVRRKRRGICTECGTEHIVFAKNDKEFFEQECTICVDTTLMPLSSAKELGKLLSYKEQ